MSYYENDSKRPRIYQGGGGRGGGGRSYGGGGGGGGRGQSGGGRGGWDARPNSLMVITNQFKLSDPSANLDYYMKQKWYKYDVTIFDAKKTKAKDSEGNVVEPWQFILTPIIRGGDTKTIDIDMGSNTISRRILFKLQKRLFSEQKYFVVSEYQPAKWKTVTCVPDSQLT